MAEERGPSDLLAQLLRAFRGALRSAALGAGAYVGAGVVSGVASGKLLASPLPHLCGLVTMDTVRFAVFCGLSSAVYRAVLALLRAYLPNWEKYHHLLAGVAAGAVSVVDDPARQLTLATILTARALGVVIINLNRQGRLPTIPRFVTLVLALSQSLATMAMVRYPSYLAPGYYRALLKWSQYYTHDVLETYFRHPLPRPVSCAVLHASSCHSAAAVDFRRGLWLYFKIYVTLYAIPAVIFKREKLLKEPLTSLRVLLTKSSRSALFFAVEASLIKYTFCLLRNALSRPPPVPGWIPFLSGLVGSLGLLIEHPSRLVELNYYVFPQVLYALTVILKRAHLPVQFITLSVFSLSCGVLLRASHDRDPSLHPLLARTLDILYNT